MTSATPGPYLLLKITAGTRKNLSENYPQFEHVLSKKKFVEPVLIRKSLQNIGLKERQIIGVPVAPTCLGPVLDRKTIQNKYRSASS
jgi:hypothetical protein